MQLGFSNKHGKQFAFQTNYLKRCTLSLLFICMALFNNGQGHKATSH